MLAVEGAETSAPVRSGMAVLAVVLLVAFILRERRAVAPLLPLSLFGDAAFSGGVAAAWLQYGALFICNFMLPFFLEDAHGWSAARAGLIMTAQPAGGSPERAASDPATRVTGRLSAKPS